MSNNLNMHESMERLYFAAKKLKGISGRGYKSAIARLFNVGPDAMTNWEKRGMSAESMIQAEIIIGCSAAWLKTGKGDIIKRLSLVKNGTINITKVPLLTYGQIRNWINELDKKVEEEQWIPCPSEHGEQAFCLRVEGISMTSPTGEHAFYDGEYLLVDPDHKPFNECFVIAGITQQDTPLFRQLIIEGGNRYLKALNPAWPNQIIRLTDEAVIYGVVTFKWASLLKR